MHQQACIVSTKIQITNESDINEINHTNVKYNFTTVLLQRESDLIFFIGSKEFLDFASLRLSGFESRTP